MKGGHNIPDDIVHRRHAQGLRLLQPYVAACDEVEVFHADESPMRIFTRSDGNACVVDGARFDLLQAAIRIAGGTPIVI
jgi:predicted ABC-type ATPase